MTQFIQLELEEAERSTSQPTNRSSASPLSAPAASTPVSEHNARRAESARHAEAWVADLPQLNKKPLQLHYTDESIFNAPANSVIVHACNTRGYWGKGIALELRREYPVHYLIYKDICSEKASRDLLGTSLLIAPFGMNQSPPGRDTLSPRHKHWIACLFVSEDIGRDESTQRRSEQSMLCHTISTMLNLANHIKHAHSVGSEPGELHMPQINSGLFQIPWRRTVEALEEASGRQLYFNSGMKIHVHMFES